jgi:hypothetical protein
MNVIFLDFNGVLDTNENLDVIDEGNLKRLKQLVDMFEAKVVISSSLKNTYYYTGRYGKMLQGIIDTLLTNGIDVIGITPKAESREEEIRMYLDSHPEVSNYCILDDDYEMELLSDHLVKLPMQMSEGQMGFTQEYLDKAINILGSK